MGLDVTAYQRLLEVIEPEWDVPGQEITNWRTEWFAYPSTCGWTEENWPGFTGQIKAGSVYTYVDKFSFRAGSYSGYNVWRDELAKLAGYGSADNVWRDPGKTGSFVELIRFADNEGIIGAKISAKLAKDFEEYQADFLARSELFMFRDRYDGWAKAFALAADDGAVELH